MNDELEKMNKFFSDFHISERTNTLVLRYVFDVKTTIKPPRAAIWFRKRFPLTSKKPLRA